MPLSAVADVKIAEGEVRAPADALVETLSVRPGDLVPAGRRVLYIQGSPRSLTSRERTASLTVVSAW